MGANDQLKNWFTSSKYKYPDIAKPDVLRAFQNFKDLRPTLETFVFNDGNKKELVSLDGTIPVKYKGNIYNIPICIWLLDTHPYNAPIVYVKPTSTMQIKPGRYVDPNGKINLPYLLNWRFPQSDLNGLLYVLTIQFGEEPPVFSKVSSTRHPTQQPTPTNAYTPDQSETSWSGSTATNQGLGHPPYPTGQSPFMPMPSPATSGSMTPYTSQYPSSQTTTGYTNSSSAYPGQMNYQNPYSYPTPTGYPLYPGSHHTQTVSGTSTVTEEHIKVSLLSAVEETLKRRLKETFAQAQAEMDTLYKTQNDLQKGRECLERMVKSLEQEKDEVEKNISILKEKNAELKEALNRMENQGELKIDDAVVTTAPLYRQLLNAFAEEQALEDAIYYLGEALRRNVIDIDIFLKQVRELSWRQFMLRAIIQKCREKAGLPALT
ncbi:TSG101 [Acanthosepion pharaonis]|uniref:TSG101 n=1 Tax=Acanthosepion pharaonis TaxID=158019 RepID=A0A812DID6_ACAPH|nr:TSG101 [Sepia pharaonis]